MRYELSHDSIARQVFDKAAGEVRLRRKIEREIREAHEAYNSRGAKLTRENVDYFLPFLPMVNISDDQASFVIGADRKLKAVYMAELAEEMLNRGVRQCGYQFPYRNE